MRGASIGFVCGLKKVHNWTWGPQFGYRGSFQVEWQNVGPGAVPSHILPVRQERRE